MGNKGGGAKRHVVSARSKEFKEIVGLFGGGGGGREVTTSYILTLALTFCIN